MQMCTSRATKNVVVACLTALTAGSLSGAPAYAVKIEVAYVDVPGQGFNDPTRGTQRKKALASAIATWADLIPGSVKVVVEVSWASLAPNVAANARPSQMARDYTGLPLKNIWYPLALANQLVAPARDLNGAAPEMRVHFNLGVDAQDSNFGGKDFCYEVEGCPGTGLDFIAVALHELAHGFGFLSEVTATGAWDTGYPSVWDSHLVVGAGRARLVEMTDLDRGIAIVSDALAFDGPRIRRAHQGVPVAVYAPSPFEPGSSVSHWSKSSEPDQLLAPRVNLVLVLRHPGLALDAVYDMRCPPGDPSAISCTVNDLRLGMRDTSKLVSPRGKKRLQHGVLRIEEDLRHATIRGDGVGCEEAFDNARGRARALQSWIKRRERATSRPDAFASLSANAKLLARQCRNVARTYCKRRDLDGATNGTLSPAAGAVAALVEENRAHPTARPAP
jgi:hypothetical protein